MAWIAAICTIMGIGLEMGQYVMQVGRSFEGLDMVANVLGVAGGIIIAPWLWGLFSITPGSARGK